nr:Calcium-binding EF-hand [Ipomoea batatas]
MVNWAVFSMDEGNGELDTLFHGMPPSPISKRKRSSQIVDLFSGELHLNRADILSDGPHVLSDPFTPGVHLLRVNSVLGVQVLDLAVRENPVELNSSTWALRRSPPVLPPKMGDGVLGSRVGGVNPTGASLVGASVVSSAMARMGRHAAAGLFRPLGTTEKQWRDCFQGAATRSAAGLAAESGEAKREAWAAMAMELKRSE